MPEVVSAKPGAGFLTAPTDDRVGAMRGFLSSYADGYGLSQDQVASLELVADYTNPAGNMAWVEFEQKINGLPVFRGLIRGGFTAKGELARTTGPLAAGLDAAALADVARADGGAGGVAGRGERGLERRAERARAEGERTAASVTFAPRRDGGRAEGVAGVLSRWRRAWRGWRGRPRSGATPTRSSSCGRRRRDGAVPQEPDELSDAVGDLQRVQRRQPGAAVADARCCPARARRRPFIARTLVTLIGNEAPNTFNNLGWMTDGTNITDGNNVEAGHRSSMAPDGVDAPVTGAARVFNFAYNPQTDEPCDRAPYQNGEVTDMFYWTNLYHDRLYLLGFTEAARNFQNDNFGRGGVAGDRVSAEVAGLLGHQQRQLLHSGRRRPRPDADVHLPGPDSGSHVGP